MNTVWYVVLGLMLILFFTLRKNAWLRRRAMARDEGGSSRRDSGGPAMTREYMAFQDAVHKLLVEMQETGRELIARVDTKSRVLDQLLVEAERRSAEIKHLCRKAEEAVDAALRARRELEGLPSVREAAAPSEPPAPSSEPPPPETRASRDRAPAGGEDRVQEILRYAERGMSPRQIESKTGVPLGEVELLLRMHKLSGGKRELSLPREGAPVPAPARPVGPGASVASDEQSREADPTLADDDADLSAQEMDGIFGRRSPEETPPG